MSHGEEIRKIKARNDISPDQKRDQIYEIKSKAFKGVADQVVGEWMDGDLTITVTSFEVDDQHRAIVNCYAVKSGTFLDLNLPLIYVNPPLMHNGIEDPLMAMKQVITDTVMGAD